MSSTKSTNEAKDAVAAFCKNPVWRRYYENAPEGAKGLIRLQFMANARSGGKAVVQLMRRQDVRLAAADWKYLYDFARDNRFIGQAVGFYRRQYENALHAYCDATEICLPQ